MAWFQPVLVRESLVEKNYRTLEPLITNDEEIIADIHSSVYGLSENDFSGGENDKRVRESFKTFAGQVVYHLKNRDTHS